MWYYTHDCQMSHCVLNALINRSVTVSTVSKHFLKCCIEKLYRHFYASSILYVMVSTVTATLLRALVCICQKNKRQVACMVRLLRTCSYLRITLCRIVSTYIYLTNFSLSLPQKKQVPQPAAKAIQCTRQYL